MSDHENAIGALGLPRGSEHVEGVHDVERLEAAQRCSFGCADWRRHCTRPAVYETTTLRACEEHRQQFDTIGGPDSVKRGWRRIDGGAVALVLVVLAFMLCPGCGEGSQPNANFGLVLAAAFIVILAAYVVLRVCGSDEDGAK